MLIQALAAYDGVVGDPSVHGPVAERVVAAARAAGAVEAHVVALRAVARYERSQLRNAAARRLLDEAAALAARAGLDHRRGEVLLARAAVDLELGRVRVAVRDLDRAGLLLAPEAMPELEFMRAALLHNVGRVAAAVDGYRRALDDPHAAVDVRVRAGNNLALLEVQRGRPVEALARIDDAVRLAAEVGPTLAAVVAHTRGQVLAEAGRLPESLRQFDEATEHLAAADLPLGEFLSEYAETLARLRALPEARDVAARGAAELEAHDVPLMAAEAVLQLAEIALLQGDHDVARAAGARAVEHFRSQRRPTWMARATVVELDAAARLGPLDAADLARLRRSAAALARSGQVAVAVEADLVAGRAARDVGRAAEARKRLTAAFTLSRQGTVLVRLRGRLAAALAAEQDGAAAEVLLHCRTGLRDLARHRAAFASTELRALASGHGLELGLLGLGFLLAAGRPTAVLEWVERTRAVALLGVDPPAPEAVREERAELAAVQAELVGALRGGRTEPAALVERQREIERRIRIATWRRRAVGGAPPDGMAVRTLVQKLGGRSLVSFGRHGEDLFAVTLHAGRRRLHRLGPWRPVRFEADALLFALRRMTRPGPARALAAARAGAEHALGVLRERLLDPLGLPPGVALVVIPARGTHRVPWTALHDGPVEIAPSAALWARTAEAGVPEDRRVVIVGGPGLAGTGREVAAVRRHHPGATVLAPPDSTPDAVLAAVAEADLVHLACHGLLRADNPTFSALQVSDGRITVHELDLRGIAPRRIVLAACDSAADVVYAGDELVGFTGALLARGTAGVVASVVAVGDVEAVDLMDALHRELAGGATMAAALRRARPAAAPDDPVRFVNWCAFGAYGAG